ncbi:N-acetylmuramoyl-L-alanine amidase [bacterium]|nr:N-acetylmuramoyl-L-alanine amidase [bacterium]
MKFYKVQFAIATLLLLLLSAAPQSEPQHVKYIAQTGDGIFSVLRKYGLDKSNCNYQYFFKINNIHDDKNLIRDAVYELPIRIFTYDDNSIRSTIGDNNMVLAKMIQDYNNLMVEAGLKNQNYTENKELWVPFNLLECDYPKVHAGVLTEGKFPIFGPQYSNIDPIDNSLNGWVYYIISGHGGPDPGAMAEIDGHTVSEDEYAYDISLRLTRNLIAHGATAYMITRDPNDGIRDTEYLECDNDEYCYPNDAIPLSQMDRLRQRSRAVNKLYTDYKKQGKKQLAICIHIDSRSTEKRVDMFFYHHAKSNSGKQYAETLYSTIKSKYDFYNPWRGYDGDVSARDLFMLRETYPTTVYIELGNLQNPKDQDRFTIVSNRQAVADWLTDGLLKIE